MAAKAVTLGVYFYPLLATQALNDTNASALIGCCLMTMISDDQEFD